MTADELIAFEQGIVDLFNAGRIKAPVHLHGGNEVDLIRIFDNVQPHDWVTTSWRSHYHCALKKVPLDRLRVDILNRHSITLNYPDYRIVSSAIVGGSLPIAVGIAMAIKRAGGPEHVWAFAGEMTASIGMFHECVQYASGHDLPVTFVVEDNGKSVCTDTAEVWGWGQRASPNNGRVRRYSYVLPWPHAGAGKRIQF